MISSDALTAVWPNGIPPHDYGRLLKLIRAIGQPARTADPMNEAKAAPEKKPQPVVPFRVSDKQIAQVLDLLKTGPATAVDIIKASGISGPTVYAALKAGGAVIVGRMKRASGFGRGPNLWALPPSK